MTNTVEISVPCASCGGPIRFGMRRCAACGAKVPRALGAALEARLEAASDEYHALITNQRIASATLFVLGGAHIVSGVFLFVMGERTELAPSAAATAGAIVVLVINAVIGLLLLACAALSKSRPLIAITAALVVWIGIRVVGGTVLLDLPLVSAQAMVRDLVARVFVVALLVRGLYAALKAHSMKRKLA